MCLKTQYISNTNIHKIKSICLLIKHSFQGPLSLLEILSLLSVLELQLQLKSRCSHLIVVRKLLLLSQQRRLCLLEYTPFIAAIQSIIDLI